MSATDPVQAVAEVHPNYATGSHEGVRCLGCDAPIAAPGGSYTMGWNLHLIEAAVAAARPAIEREAKAAGLRNAALSLEIGQLVGARQLDAMADQIEREGQA